MGLVALDGEVGHIGARDHAEVHVLAYLAALDVPASLVAFGWQTLSIVPDEVGYVEAVALD